MNELTEKIVRVYVDDLDIQALKKLYPQTKKMTSTGLVNWLIGQAKEIDIFSGLHFVEVRKE